MPFRTRVRAALAGMAAVLVVAFAVAEGRSQPGRPPGFPGSPFPGQPGMPGPGMPGMPGPGMGMGRPPGPIGPPGGFGQPGMPGMGQPPGGTTPPFGPPNFPGGMGGPPTRPDIGGAGGLGGLPRFESVWTCSKCGHEIGRGTFKPDVANCPNCGTRFGNTMSGMQSSMREDMDAMRERNRTRLAEPFNTPMGGGAPASGTPANPGGALPNLFGPPTDAPVDEPVKNRMGLKIVGITAGLLVLVGAVVGIVLASTGKKPARRRRRRPRDWDDYDD